MEAIDYRKLTAAQGRAWDIVRSTDYIYHKSPELARVCAHLESCERLRILGVALLTIKGRTALAVEYRQERDIAPGCEAYARGQRTDTVHAWYVLGNLPPCYVRNPGSMRSSGLHFESVLGGERAEWIVAGHSTPDSERLALESGSIHYGPHYLLHKLAQPWDWAGETPKLVPMGINYL